MQLCIYYLYCHESGYNVGLVRKFHDVIFGIIGILVAFWGLTNAVS